MYEGIKGKAGLRLTWSPASSRQGSEAVPSPGLRAARWVPAGPGCARGAGEPGTPRLCAQGRCSPPRSPPARSRGLLPCPLGGRELFNLLGLLRFPQAFLFSCFSSPPPPPFPHLASALGGQETPARPQPLFFPHEAASSWLTPSSSHFPAPWHRRGAPGMDGGLSPPCQGVPAPCPALGARPRVPSPSSPAGRRGRDAGCCAGGQASPRQPETCSSPQS